MGASGFNRRLRNASKRWLRRVFEAGQRFGFDILPRHFYSSIPDVAELRGSTHWRKPSDMAGVAGTDLDAQLAFARDMIGRRRDEISRHDIHARACQYAGEEGYQAIDADFLWCFVRTRRPARIVQVGCGVSTAVALDAARALAKPVDIICIEPFPSDWLKRMDADGRIKLVARKAQEVELSCLTDLDAGDLLFVDSTHTVKPGSEVARIVLEAMPRLRPGVFVHFHDIYFPYGHQRGLLSDELFFSAESLFLQAFLTQNVRWTIRASLSMLHYARPEELKELIPHYDPAPGIDGLAKESRADKHFPSATYLESVDIRED